MSEIKINVEDTYLAALLTYLKTLNYVQISEVSTPVRPADAKQRSAADRLLETLEVNHPLRQLVKPHIASQNILELIQKQQYRGTNWQKLYAMADKMEIQQSTDELLAQLAA